MVGGGYPILPEILDQSDPALLKRRFPIYTVGEKTAPFYFCNNFVKTFYNEIITHTHGTYTVK